MEKIKFERRDSIAWAIINRPEKRNAIDDDVMDGLQQIIKQVKEDLNIKCFVITGAGTKAFCSGGDLSVFHQLHTAHEAKRMLSKMGHILFELFTMPKPTIALLNGSAVGGGCEIATACDFRIASSYASIGFIQGTLGITTGWGGATFLLERLHSQAALALLSSARKITAKEACELGFIHKVIPEEELSFEKATIHIHDLVPLSVDVLATYKKRFLDSVDLQGLRERLEKEIHDCAYLWESDKHAEAVQSFLNK